MKLIKFHKDQEDYYLQVLFTKRWALFRGLVSWWKHPGGPCLQIQFGMGAMLSITFNVYKIGISVGFFERTWKLPDFDSANGVQQ